MAQYRPPEKFSFKASEWPDWLREFNMFRRASKLHREDGDIQKDALLYSMGATEAAKVYDCLTFGTIQVPDPAHAGEFLDQVESPDDYDTLTRKLTEHFKNKSNILHERIVFGERKQRANETVEEYLREIKYMIQKCGYDRAAEEEQLTLKFVGGLKDVSIKEKLQLKDDLTLHKAVQMARQHEQIKAQLAVQDHKVPTAEVNEASYKGTGARPKTYNGQGQSSRGQGQGRGRGRGRGQGQPNQPKCAKCGYEHSASGRCPASGKTCRRCNKMGHFASQCNPPRFQNKKHQGRDRRHAADEVYIPEGYSDYAPGAAAASYDAESYSVQGVPKNCFLGAIDVEGTDPWYVRLSIQNTEVDFKVDSGADITSVSRDVYDKMKIRPKLQQTGIKLSSPGGPPPVEGVFRTGVKYKGTMYKFPVVVLSGRGGPNLLSRSVGQAMGLIEVHLDEVKSSPGIGRVKTDPVKIKLRGNVDPLCVTSARKVPFPLRDAVKKELERMLHEGVIRGVKEPTEWCAPMVAVQKKSGDVRICVDLKVLNKAVCREHYTLPSLDEIAPKLAGSKYFSRLDAASGFWQIPLDEDSQLLTTFMTPFGRFAFTRMPFGITSAPEIFQRKMAEILEGLEGTEVIMDDILVHGRTIEEHDERLKKLLQRLEEVSLKLNAAKCQFRVPELVFFGHLVGRDGVRPDPEKVAAIMKLEPPENVGQLRSIVGMFQYLGKFTQLADVMKPMTELMKSDRAWTWGPAQEEAFKKTNKHYVKHQLWPTMTRSYLPP